MLLWYAGTLFASALLLFLVQPMIARMILPLLGGTPAVWNTCMFFFQVALLGGYLYAHASTARLPLRRQALLHLGLLLLPFALLPLRVAQGAPPPAESSPIPWLLVRLLGSVGLPFFLVSASAPLLQKWFAMSGHPAARDPYFLYGASNLGSMVALLGYPLLVEPRLLLMQQSLLWEVGYGLLVVLIGGCALLVWRAPAVSVPAPSFESPEAKGDGDALAAGPLPRIERLRWVALAFAPSSLMLGVTTYLSTDIAAIPLLWVIPLALYLLTFILAFGKMPAAAHQALLRAVPVAVLLLCFTSLFGGTHVRALIPLHLVVFFLVALACHGELARRRPPTRHLTEFYLWMSVGGALGGSFNGLLAPLVFKSVMEYPLVLILACALLLGTRRPGPAGRWLGLGWPAVLGVLGAVLTFALGPARLKVGPLGGSLSWDRPLFSLACLLPWVLCYAVVARSLRFGLGLSAVVFLGLFFRDVPGQVLHRERGFFGVLMVKQEPRPSYHRLVHGTTLHGRQDLDPAHRREPLTYYHHDGPIGQVFAALQERRPAHVALVGLGTGTLSAYGEPGQHLTFYEIDPGVVRIARDPRYFTFLADCRAEYEVVLGDARLRLGQAPPGRYGLIVVDAFSSDAVPVHFLTREAMRLYLDKLADGGLLAFHISNRYFRLAPVLGNLARDAGLAGLLEDDQGDEASGRDHSTWVVIGRQARDLRPLSEDPRWKPLVGRPSARLWTDDFSDPLSVFVWRTGS